MFNEVLIVGVSAVGLAAILAAPQLMETIRARRRLHHRLEDLRRLRQ